MKYIYFDMSSGFSPAMALGALIDMFREEGYVNSVLLQFDSAVYTQNVQRGYSEGCLAHIDICDSTVSKLESCQDESMAKITSEFTNLCPDAGVREALEVICTLKLVESFGIQCVFYFDECPESENTNAITPAGHALLEILKSTPKPPQNGEITAVGYGADSPVQNPDGILRVMMYEEGQSDFFASDSAFEALFAEETELLQRINK